MSLLELFCHVDDFWNVFAPRFRAYQVQTRAVKRQRPRQLAESEVMTILIAFHQSHYHTFKAYYTEYVWVAWRAEFPGLVSYSRFVELIPSVLVPLCAYLEACRGVCTGISFVDSTPLAVCKNPRLHQHRVFAGLAQRGKNSVGWFFGFKLHLIVNHHGELLAWQLTAGNTDDRQPLPEMVRGLTGKLIGDKGYLSQPLLEQLLQQGLHLITPLRKNMPNRLLPLTDKLLQRKRAITETINDQLKNQAQIEHSRHRSPTNFLVNLMAGLIAYCHQLNKPSLRFGTGTATADSWAVIPN
jgi:HPt (histidine-containing phosphotransfer) domain-containing protein